jgi:hypothetical protein
MDSLPTTSSSSGEENDFEISHAVRVGENFKEMENRDECGADKSDGRAVIVEAVPTKKTQHEAPIKDGLFSQQARFVARKPWLCFGVAFIIATALSVVGLLVGDFQVAADNAGWRTRGTLIANRHQQVTLVLFNRGRLITEGEAAWEDLTNNVQPGWESDDDDEERRLTSLDEAFEPPALGGNTSTPCQEHTFALTQSTKRRLQDNAFAKGWRAVMSAGKYTCRYLSSVVRILLQRIACIQAK